METKREEGARARYMRTTTERARAAFERHEVVSSSEGRWLLKRRHADGGWESDYWVEVVVLAGGGLLVWGDVDAVVFAYGGSPGASRVAWLGSHERADEYVQQKARIGLGDASCLEELDVDAWLEDAEASREYLGEDATWLDPVVDSVRDDPQNAEAATRELLESAAGADAHEAGAGDWGRVPSTRLVYAHAALRKLHGLLSDVAPTRVESGRVSLDQEGRT